MDKKGIEKACLEIVDGSINMAIPWYIMAAYAYYIDDDPILEDRTFDLLAKKILKDWDEITHLHKDCLTEDMLKSGTYLGEYPTRVKGALKSVRETYK